MNTRRMNNNVLEICNKDGEAILSFAESMENDVLLIKLEGQIKNEVAHEFEDEVMAALSVCPKLAINLEKVTYISSMAMKSLLSAQQMIDEIDGASMTLVKVSPIVMEKLKESGLYDILSIEE